MIDWGNLTDLNAGGEVAWGNIAAGELTDNSVQADDIDTINCGTNCTWDATNDEIDVDDAFLKNNAADTTSFGITMGSASTTDTLYVGTYLMMNTAGDNFIYFDQATTNYCQWDDSEDFWNWSNDVQITGTASSTTGFRINDGFTADDGHGTTTNSFTIGDDTHGLLIEYDGTNSTTLRFY